MTTLWVDEQSNIENIASCSLDDRWNKLKNITNALSGYDNLNLGMLQIVLSGDKQIELYNITNTLSGD